MSTDKYAIFRKGFEATLRNEDKTFTFEMNVNGDYIDERVKKQWDTYVSKFHNSAVPFKPEKASWKRPTEKGNAPKHNHPVRKQAPQKQFNTLKEDFESFCKEQYPELSLEKVEGKGMYVDKGTVAVWVAYNRAYKQAYHHLLNKARETDQGPWIIGKRLLPYSKSKNPEESRKEFTFAKRPYFHQDKDEAMLEAQKLANEHSSQFMVFSLSMVLKPETTEQPVAKEAAQDAVTPGPRVIAITPCEKAEGGSGGETCNTLQTPEGERCIISPGLMKIEEPAV